MQRIKIQLVNDAIEFHFRDAVINIENTREFYGNIVILYGYITLELTSLKGTAHSNVFIGVSVIINPFHVDGGPGIQTVRCQTGTVDTT